MTGYPFINELFTNILLQSAGIQGRFYICPKNGNELFSESLDQVIQDVVKTIEKAKYPLCLMMPPLTRGDFTDKSGWVYIKITLFFLKTIYYDSTNKVANPNKKTATSTHTVVQDWHDMMRCAVNFLTVLDRLQRRRNLATTSFRLDKQDQSITPVSFISGDRTAGVRLDFNASVFIGCEEEDYTDENIAAIELPEGDSHPAHAM